ncbi:hypothetical protein D3218_12865 [Aureimonas flava]|uniref:Uncharacterized protein n=1 Tax=Aureimonas flava TaxID=2320271 RepID=A0A3A1WHV6_9HYPH|nr:hypothetical protein [Aureimonas flava]RIY00174.1 hypothetical protein D3218_12865 [Aureimonas flava]
MIPEDVRKLASDAATECMPFETRAWYGVKHQIEQAIMADRASRLPRQEDEIRKAALEEIMSGQPAPDWIWATGDGRNGSWVSEEPHAEWQSGAVEYVRALSQKGDEADG